MAYYQVTLLVRTGLGDPYDVADMVRYEVNDFVEEVISAKAEEILYGD